MCLLIYHPLTTCGTRALRPLVMSKGYHTGIITSIHLNIMQDNWSRKYVMHCMVFGWWNVQEFVDMTDRPTGCGEVVRGGWVSVP